MSLAITDIQLAENHQSILLFGGIYSNLHALQSLKKIADDLGMSADQVFCAGDTVAYCGFPKECLDLVEEWGIHHIAGNVEVQLREGAEDCGCDFSEGSRCDIFSNQWYPKAQKMISKENLKWMESIPDAIRFDWAGRKWLMIHGSLDHRSEYIYESTDWATKEKIHRDSKSNSIIAGHSGLPFFQSQEDNLWINAGVIGMPANDGLTSTWYAVIKLVGSELKVEFHQLEYDHVSAAKLMREKGFTEAYAKTLEDGIWDNMEILTEPERLKKERPMPKHEFSIEL
ncbi:MAG: metallophosphoesterase family protein [Flavobacteriales bacterium]|nr:metallophosphoesterase family protein [Flavobacteriales bacterium]